MTRMTGPNRAVMCNLIIIHIGIRTYIHICTPDSAKAEGGSIVDEPGEG